jgi:hypothetical protein
MPRFVIPTAVIATMASLTTRAIKREKTMLARPTIIVTRTTLMVAFTIGTISVEFSRAQSGPATVPRERPATRELVNGIIARADGIFSGRIKYHVKSGFTNSGKVSQEGEYQFSFSGDSWARRTAEGGATVSHGGKFVRYAVQPQKDGTVQTRAAIRISKSVDQALPSPTPPYFAGTFWHKCTRQFVKDHAGEARLLERGREVNGVATDVLEWKVPADRISKAFAVVSAPERLRQPAMLRVYVAPQYGYALARIEQLFGTDGSEKDEVYDSGDFQEAGQGLFFPRKCKRQSFSAVGLPGYFVQYEIVHIDRVNEVIPEEDFLVTLAEGTSVTDARKPKHAMSFRVNPLLAFPPDLKDVVAPGDAPSPYGWKFLAIVVGVIVGIVLLISYWLVRRWVSARYERH